MNDRKVLALFSALVCIFLLIIAYMGSTLHSLRQQLEGSPGLNPAAQQPLSNNAFDPWVDSWTPFADIDAMRRRMTQIMDEMSAGRMSRSNDRFNFSMGLPLIYLEEDAKHYRVTVDVPEDYEIELNTAIKDQVLTVSGEFKNKSQQFKQGQSVRLMQSSEFSRAFTLSDPVDESSLKVDKQGDKFVATISKVP